MSTYFILQEVEVPSVSFHANFGLLSPETDLLYLGFHCIGVQVCVTLSVASQAFNLLHLYLVGIFLPFPELSRPMLAHLSVLFRQQSPPLGSAPVVAGPWPSSDLRCTREESSQHLDSAGPWCPATCPAASSGLVLCVGPSTKCSSFIV